MSGDRTKQEGDAIAFAKMHGAGNDFVLVNGATQRLPADLSALAVSICGRKTSIGADGFVIVEPSARDDADVRFRFWNPDGSEIGTCGNGTRCAARFAADEGLAPPDGMDIETDGGDIRARVSGERVALRFAVVPGYEADFEVTAAEQTLRGHYVDVGNQHFVLPVDALPDGPIELLCRPMREAPELAPLGANINLAEVVDRHRIRIRTYERGVEAETLACGSGSMSSAVALSATGAVEPPVDVEARSGDLLTVRFERTPDGVFKDLELEGPAVLVYRGLYCGA